MTMTLTGSGTGTVGVPNSATAQNATGTAVDFTGIPAGIKRITVMFNGVSLNGSSTLLLQLGAGGAVETTGYNGSIFYVNSGGSGGTSFTSGISLYGTGGPSVLNYGTVVFTLLGSNTWTVQGGVSSATFSSNSTVYGSKTLSGTLDRVRITTANGTDTFDAGSINILYE